MTGKLYVKAYKVDYSRELHKCMGLLMHKSTIIHLRVDCYNCDSGTCAFEQYCS